jgi:hypothetical protein
MLAHTLWLALVHVPFGTFIAPARHLFEFSSRRPCSPPARCAFAPDGPEADGHALDGGGSGGGGARRRRRTIERAAASIRLLTAYRWRAFRGRSFTLDNAASSPSSPASASHPAEDGVLALPVLLAFDVHTGGLYRQTPPALDRFLTRPCPRRTRRYRTLS